MATQLNSFRRGALTKRLMVVGRDVAAEDGRPAGRWWSADLHRSVDMTGVSLGMARDDLLSQRLGEEQRREILACG